MVGKYARAEERSNFSAALRISSERDVRRRLAIS
jgi:hypothetical protein